jgi:hypothetical protein
MTTQHVRWLILGAGWSLAVLYAFPGMMSWDSSIQLDQARGLASISDWHPPVMAVIWRYVDHIIAGPFGMLLLQTGTFLFGLDAVLQRALRPAAAAGVAVGCLLFPPVLAPMAVIWKDSQMAGLLLAGAALILAERRCHRLLGLAVLVVATAMRYNAAAATAPLLVLLLNERSWHWQRYVIGTVAWVIVTILAFGVSRALTERPDYAWHNSVALFDIGGTIRYTPDYSDAEIERDLVGVPLVVHHEIQAHCTAAYDPAAYDALTSGDRRVFDPPGDRGLEPIAVGWRTMVTRHFAGYLRHRWAVFRTVLGFSQQLHAPVWTRFANDDQPQTKTVHVAIQRSALQRGWMAVLHWLATTWMFRPHLYAVLLILLLPLSRSQLSRAILLSGLLYELGLFVAAPSNDFRYSHWMIVAALVGAVLTLRSRLDGPARPATPAG